MCWLLAAQRLRSIILFVEVLMVLFVFILYKNLNNIKSWTHTQKCALLAPSRDKMKYFMLQYNTTRTKTHFCQQLFITHTYTVSLARKDVREKQHPCK